MADNEQKAMQLMAEAEKKLTSNKGFFGSLFGCVFFHQKFSPSVCVYVLAAIAPQTPFRMSEKSITKFTEKYLSYMY